MSEIVKICDKCCLERLTAGNGTVNLIYNEIEPENCAAASDAEFNRLAMEAPLFKKVVDYLNTYSHNNAGRQLLAEITELEKK